MFGLPNILILDHQDLRLNLGVTLSISYKINKSELFSNHNHQPSSFDSEIQKYMYIYTEMCQIQLLHLFFQLTKII